jgi:hypothetical protein
MLVHRSQFGGRPVVHDGPGIGQLLVVTVRFTHVHIGSTLAQDGSMEQEKDEAGYEASDRHQK